MDKDYEKFAMQEINYQVRRVTEELNKKRRNLGQLNVHLATLAGMAEGFNLRVVDEIKRKQGAYEAAMIEKMAKTKLPTLDEVNTNPTGSGNGPGHWTEV